MTEKLIATADTEKLPQVDKNMKHISSEYMSTKFVENIVKYEICFVFFSRGVSNDAGESCRTNHT